MVVADGEPLHEALVRAVSEGVDLVVTTGGTGHTPMDLTPEMTLRVVERLSPGLAEAVRAHGVANGVPTAILSRGIAGIAGTTLIVNLPGSSGGARDGIAALAPVLLHAHRPGARRRPCPCSEAPVVNQRWGWTATSFLTAILVAPLAYQVAILMFPTSSLAGIPVPVLLLLGILVWMIAAWAKCPPSGRWGALATTFFVLGLALWAYTAIGGAIQGATLVGATIAVPVALLLLLLRRPDEYSIWRASDAFAWAFAGACAPHPRSRGPGRSALLVLAVRGRPVGPGQPGQVLLLAPVHGPPRPRRAVGWSAPPSEPDGRRRRGPARLRLHAPAGERTSSSAAPVSSSSCSPARAAPTPRGPSGSSSSPSCPAGGCSRGGGPRPGGSSPSGSASPWVFGSCGGCRRIRG